MFSIFAILIGVAFVIFVIRMSTELFRRLKDLGEDTSNEKVADFIKYIQKANIPNEPKYWNALRASYKLVINEPGIDKNLKHELRKALLSRGVNI